VACVASEVSPDRHQPDHQVAQDLVGEPAPLRATQVESHAFGLEVASDCPVGGTADAKPLFDRNQPPQRLCIGHFEPRERVERRLVVVMERRPSGHPPTVLEEGSRVRGEMQHKVELGPARAVRLEGDGLRLRDLGIGGTAVGFQRDR
jgi:hypothetical protein